MDYLDGGYSILYNEVKKYLPTNRKSNRRWTEATEVLQEQPNEKEQMD